MTDKTLPHAAKPPAEGVPVERTVRPDPERAAFEADFAESRRGRGVAKRPTFERLGDDTYADDHTQRHWWTWQKGSAWRREYDATPDQIIELTEALQVRRILEEIKKVAAIHPAADMPTPFQSAWHGACEEIFYRATGEQWHMDEDAEKFSRRPANDPRA